MPLGPSVPLPMPTGTRRHHREESRMSAPFYHCPHCQRETGQFVTSRDGHLLEAHRCPDHGEVSPESVDDTDPPPQGHA